MIVFIRVHSCPFVVQKLPSWGTKRFPKIQGKVDYIAKKKLELAMIHLDDSTKASIIRLNNYTENEVEKRNDYKKNYSGNN